MQEMQDLAAEMSSQAQRADELYAESRRLLREAALAGYRAGMTQREIAALIGRSQPETLRILRFNGVTPLAKRINKNRQRILALLKRNGFTRVRVFGSVATGTDTADSDVDLLVDAKHSLSLLEHSQVEINLEKIIGAPVEIVSEKHLRHYLKDRVLSEVVPL